MPAIAARVGDPRARQAARSVDPPLPGFGSVQVDHQEPPRPSALYLNIGRFPLLELLSWKRLVPAVPLDKRATRPLLIGATRERVEATRAVEFSPLPAELNIFGSHGVRSELPRE